MAGNRLQTKMVVVAIEREVGLKHILKYKISKTWHTEDIRENMKVESDLFLRFKTWGNADLGGNRAQKGVVKKLINAVTRYAEFVGKQKKSN